MHCLIPGIPLHTQQCKKFPILWCSVQPTQVDVIGFIKCLLYAKWWIQGKNKKISEKAFYSQDKEEGDTQSFLKCDKGPTISELEAWGIVLNNE